MKSALDLIIGVTLLLGAVALALAVLVLVVGLVCLALSGIADLLTIDNLIGALLLGVIILSAVIGGGKHS